MPIVSRPLRALAAAPLLFAMLLGAAPSPAAALEPPRPLPGYRPTFVTQTDEHPMNDCLWASAAMLIEKWTNGDIHPTHQRLRALSGDRHGGSNLDDLKKAYKKLGINLKFSPNGGERITFNGLLRRLAHGAGAVVLGDDSKLPRWYGRWDYGFWKMTKKEKKKHPSRDNHAVYVERYDRRHGRVWLMDPLAKGDWHGEWISIWALRKFAWSSGGALYTAVTPTAKPAPFAHVTTSAASLSLTTNALQAQWSFRAPRRWHFPGVTTRTAFAPAADPVLAAATAPDIATRLADGNPPLHTYLTLDGRSLTATAPLPKTPGAYLGSFKLTDRRFGRTVAAVSGVPVFVPGHRTATVRIHAIEDTVEADSGRAAHDLGREHGRADLGGDPGRRGQGRRGDAQHPAGRALDPARGGRRDGGHGAPADGGPRGRRQVPAAPGPRDARAHAPRRRAARRGRHHHPRADPGRDVGPRDRRGG